MAKKKWYHALFSGSKVDVGMSCFIFCFDIRIKFPMISSHVEDSIYRILLNQLNISVGIHSNPDLSLIYYAVELSPLVVTSSASSHANSSSRMTTRRPRTMGSTRKRSPGIKRSSSSSWQPTSLPNTLGEFWL
jgi:hypothetical protein